MSSSALAIISNLYTQECWLIHLRSCFKILSCLYESSSVLVNVKHFCCDCWLYHRMSGYNSVVPVFNLHFFINGPISIFFKPLFQSEAKCEAIDMKTNFYSQANKTHFHNKGFVLSLVLKVAVFGTWKWPISTRKTTISICYCFLRLIRNLNLKLVITKVYGVRATTIESQNALLHCYALGKSYVTDSQNMRDPITRDRRSKCAWSNGVICILFILSGSPNDATYMQSVRNNNLDIRIAGSSCRLQQCAMQNNFTTSHSAREREKKFITWQMNFWFY